jgi:class 3 adenylate cyclase
MLNSTETGHVLFLDLVGYSRLSLEEQAASVTKLLECVRATKAFQSAERSGELIPIATGDGVALVFLRYATAPLDCACEVQESAAPLSLRMGIHVGPITRIHDINGAISVTGGGINTAKRIMDMAEAGEVLLSEAAVSLVKDHDAWKERLKSLGTRETKHGGWVSVYALLPPAPRVPSGCQPWEEGEPEGVLPPPILAPRIGRRVGEEGTPGGAVPLRSEHYVTRAVDAQFHAALERQEAIVLLKGARQVGKTSLLARGLHAARHRGTQVAILDFQSFGSDVLASAESLYRAMAESLCEQLDLETSPESHWNASRSGAANLERYLRRVVVVESERPLVWGLDEADRLFPLSFGSEVFGLLRSWHNRRSLDPQGPWHRLTIALAYATEAHLFITDPNQSPFNVGVRLQLTDFTQSEVQWLAERYEVREITSLFALLSGHPYLTRKGLEVLAAGEALETTPAFDNHLERLLFSLTQEPCLAEALHQILRGKAPSHDAFFRLRAAGVIVGESATKLQLRCPLYETYLRKHFE